MARRYNRDRIGRFAGRGGVSSGGGKTSVRAARGKAASDRVESARTARAGTGGADTTSNRMFNRMDSAVAASKAVVPAPKGSSRSGSAALTTARKSYEQAVVRRTASMRGTSPGGFSRKAERSVAAQIGTSALRSSAKSLAKNPNDPSAKRAVQLSRMVAAVGGVHPRQRISRKRS
jgi:hypothetical protein